MSSEVTQIRRRQADFADRLATRPPTSDPGSPTIVAKIRSIPSGTGPRFFPINLTYATGPIEPIVAGNAGVFAETTEVEYALSILGGPTSGTPHVECTLVNGYWVFEAT